MVRGFNVETCARLIEGVRGCDMPVSGRMVHGGVPATIFQIDVRSGSQKSFNDACKSECGCPSEGQTARRALGDLIHIRPILKGLTNAFYGFSFDGFHQCVMRRRVFKNICGITNHKAANRIKRSEHKDKVKNKQANS